MYWRGIHLCLCVVPGAHKRKERVTSVLYRSNQEVKSSASGCGVTLLDDYHIRLVCCSQTWPDGYDLEPIRVNGLWVPGLGQLILNACVIDTTCFPHMRIQSSIVWRQLRSQVTRSFLLWAPGRAEGDPRPSIIWYKDKVAIRRNDVNVTEAKQSNGGDYQYEV